MMIVLGPILLIVDYASPILWTIGLTFLIIGIVLVAGGTSRHAWRGRFRH
jgi:Ca2+/Na+ antiporter